MEKHIPNLIAGLWAFGFFAILLLFSKLVRPFTKKRVSLRAFGDTGVENAGGGEKSIWIRMTGRYQILLSVAAIFFLGILLLYPAMTAFRQRTDEGHGVSALIAVGLFLSTLSVALAYSWMRGDLNWIKDAERAIRSRHALDKEENGNPRERIS